MEMSIAESVLQIIEDKARADGYARVRAVWLEIGQLAAVRAGVAAFLLRCGDTRQHCQGCAAGDHRDRGAGLVHGLRPQCGIAGTL